MSMQTHAHLDVLIIGAGISGIDAAYHLRKDRPGTRFAIIEAQDQLGGTWNTHRFPGIRSDSDLFTFGFKWKPWTGVPIATADEILRYLKDAVTENDIDQHIRFSTRVVSADWSDAAQHWVVTLEVNGDRHQLTCGFMWMCAGYYKHSEGYTPQWDGMDTFEGDIVHPQTWPETLDYADKRVAVIGSGATAATIVPAMAQSARHVVIVQRSPTYYFSRPMMDDFATTLSALNLPDAWYHETMRRKFLRDGEITAKRSREEPEALAEELIAGVRQQVGDDDLVKAHFTPRYSPWRQRLALLPDGDMFRDIKEGRASVVTDAIDRFTPTGLQMASGAHVEADIIVTATGLQLNMFGDIALSTDGTPVDISQKITHRGIMFTGLPNFGTVFGYLRSSWTLRADLVSQYLCRVLDHMEAKGATKVVPQLRPQDLGMTERPWIDPENFNPGYILRSLDALPRQGDKQPWVMTQDYFQDRDDVPMADLEDGTLVFHPAAQEKGAS